MTALEATACSALGLICSVNHLPASSPHPARQMQIWLPESRGILQSVSCTNNQQCLLIDSCAVPDPRLIEYASQAVTAHNSDRSWVLFICSLRRIGPRGYLTPLGVVSTSTFVWVVVRFALLWDTVGSGDQAMFNGHSASRKPGPGIQWLLQRPQGIQTTGQWKQYPHASLLGF